ncbi:MULTISPECIES: efflux transporter outer membrane subunit [unclassified Caballeronia]|uniref:efflux transporter outer membrane subunit n=1 Tax=unclassified Caballeronia TaxID=2646786 RepID=UPI00285A8184|nr:MULTISPECIES: efflux transporter outer membrane subunit [unclassified Caballeronia]MDR5750515.1 efflux transporter outer membrane subunit [Caballeronia sp. LZ024]MDR5842452.1 efflux transporter outer membrane subunit [Caballeronia sp. LZ031]
MMKVWKIGAVSLASALAACSFGPPAALSWLPQPAHYGALPQPERTVMVQGASQRFDVGAKPVPEWWKLYRSDALNALVAEGLRNSPNLAAADKSLAAAREQLKAQVGASLLPSIDAGAQASRQRGLGVPEFGPPTAVYNLFVGQVQAQYTFDLFGAARYQNASLAAQVDQQAFQLDAARRALAANIVTGAIGAAALAAQIDTTERLVALANDDMLDAQRRYALGSASRSEALSAEQSAASLAASLPGLRAQWLATRHALAVLLGRTPDQAPDDLDFASLAVPDSVPVVVPSELLATRPDIQAADAALKAAAAQVGVATAQLFPSLSLSASMGKGGFSWPIALSGAGALWSIGASLSQPIFHGGALLAQRRAALDTYDAAVEQYKQTVLTAFQNVANTLASLQQDTAALASSDAASRASRGVFDDTAGRVRLGALPPRAARASEQQYRNAQLSTIRYASARLTDTAALFQAMGSPTGIAHAASR